MIWEPNLKNSKHASTKEALHDIKMEYRLRVVVFVDVVVALTSEVSTCMCLRIPHYYPNHRTRPKPEPP